MKFLIAIAITATLAGVQGCSQWDSEIRNKDVEICLEKVNMSPEEFQTMKQRADGEEAGEKAKCFVKCMLEHDGVMLNGILNEDTFMQKFKFRGDGKPGEALENCKGEIGEVGEDGDEKCEIAFRFFDCVKKDQHLFEHH